MTGVPLALLPCVLAAPPHAVAVITIAHVAASADRSREQRMPVSLAQLGECL
jgi:hypothetical protein